MSNNQINNWTYRWKIGKTRRVVSLRKSVGVKRKYSNVITDCVSLMSHEHSMTLVLRDLKLIDLLSQK